MNLLLRLPFLACLFLILAANSAQAVVITVSDPADSGPNTLREAITLANGNGIPDIIRFSGPMSITLNSDLPFITEDLTIDGTTVLGYAPGSPLVSITASAGVSSGILLAQQITNFEVKGLAVSGHSPGSTYCIYANRVFNATMTENVIDNGNNAATFYRCENVVLRANQVQSPNNFRALAIVGKGSIPGPIGSGLIDVRENVFGSQNGLEITLIDGITVHDSYNAALSKQVVLEATSSKIEETPEVAVSLDQCRSFHIKNLNLSYPESITTLNTGKAIVIKNANGGSSSITDNVISNREVALEISNSSSTNFFTITDNDFRNSGGRTNNSLQALRLINALVPSTTTMHSNLWGGPECFLGMLIVNSDKLRIGDENMVNPDIVIEDNSGFNTIGGYQNSLIIQSSDDIVLDGLDLSRSSATGTGLFVQSSSNITVQNVRFNGGTNGLVSFFSAGGTVNQCSFSNLDYGINNIGGAGLVVNQNNFGCLNTAINAGGFGTPPSVDAQSNYWGHPTGSSTDGGSGAAYSGPVDASNFLTAVEALAPYAGADCPDLATGTAPEIALEDNDGDPINDGDPVAAVGNDTDFGSLSTGSDEVHTFTILNTGTAPLEVSSIDISGPQTPNFIVGGIGLPLSIPASGSATFNLRFIAASTGLSHATVTVNSDDADEAAFDFAVQGEGTGASPNEWRLVNAVSDSHLDFMSNGFVIDLKNPILFPTKKLNIEVLDLPVGIDEVYFDLGRTGSSSFNVFSAGDRSGPPFAMSRDDGNGNFYYHVFTPGDYILTAQLKTGNTLVETRTLDFSVTNPAASVTSFTLWNAFTDVPIGPLVNGQTINICNVGTRKLSIVAETSPGIVGKVQFDLTGAQTFSGNDFSSPFSIKRDNGAGNYYQYTFGDGFYTLRGTPFLTTGGAGPGPFLQISFNVVSNPSCRLKDEPLSMKVYPNPTTGKLNLNLELIEPGSASIRIFNMNGQVVYRENTDFGAGMIEYGLRVHELPVGVYTVSCRAGYEHFTARFVKQ